MLSLDGRFPGSAVSLLCNGERSRTVCTWCKSRRAKVIPAQHSSHSERRTFLGRGEHSNVCRKINVQILSLKRLKVRATPPPACSLTAWLFLSGWLTRLPDWLNCSCRDKPHTLPLPLSPIFHTWDHSPLGKIHPTQQCTRPWLPVAE